MRLCWARKKTTPRWETGKGIREGEEGGEVENVLVIARSRSSSSEFGAFNKSSTMLRSWNSVPMTWVVLEEACDA